jgi:hypothetical protein
MKRRVNLSTCSFRPKNLSNSELSSAVTKYCIPSAILAIAWQVSSRPVSRRDVVGMDPVIRRVSSISY